MSTSNPTSSRATSQTNDSAIQTFCGIDTRACIEWCARAGFVSRGVIYFLVGALAASAAVGGRLHAHTSADTQGALRRIAIAQPFGTVAVSFVAVGLACFGIWQLLRGILDLGREGTSPIGLLRRAGMILTALIYAGLVMFAVHLVSGWLHPRGESGDESARSWSAWLMSYPAGQWLVGFIGAGVAAFGLTVTRGAVADRLDELSSPELSAHARRVIVAVARFGIAARGVVFIEIGIFLMMAAYHHNPREARGLEGAFRALQSNGSGPAMLLLAALGFAAYGGYQFVQAAYRRIETRPA